MALSRSVFSSARSRIPSIRPQEYLRGYMLKEVGLGVPELQQYVTKLEPMLREMVERTQLLHSIHNIVAHFAKEDEPTCEEVAVRWPSNLMQFLEYYNTTRALEDPENQQPQVKAAFRNLMDHLYCTVPRSRYTIPVKYVETTSLLAVSTWRRLDSAQRASLPLSILERKALDVLQVENGELICSVLTAFQAKQFLARLTSREVVCDILTQTASGESHKPTESKL